MKLFRRKPSASARLAQLLQAIEEPDIAGMKRLLEDDGSLVQAHNEFGVFPLLYAILRHQPDAVNLLLMYGADPDRRSREGGTMLSLAAVEGQVDTILLLLAAKANPLAADRFGATPLMYASQLGHVAAASALLEAGADLEARDQEGETALMYAVQHAQVPLVQLLLAAGANPRARNFDNQAAWDKAYDDQLRQLIEAAMEQGDSGDTIR